MRLHMVDIRGWLHHSLPAALAAEGFVIKYRRTQSRPPRRPVEAPHVDVRAASLSRPGMRGTMPLRDTGRAAGRGTEAQSGFAHVDLKVPTGTAWPLAARRVGGIESDQFLKMRDEFGLEAADLRMKLRVLIDAYPERLVARLLKGGSRYISLHDAAELDESSEFGGKTVYTFAPPKRA